MTGRKWVDDTLFVDPEEETPRLSGARCVSCATTTFPRQDGCPRCGGNAMEQVGLPTSGTLWSFTVQYFEPKKPYRGLEPFEPFGIGYVDLGDVCVESRLTVNDPGELVLGMEFDLTTITAFLDDEGIPVETFAFTPRGDRDA